MNKLLQYLQPRDWWPRAYFWFVMIFAMSQGLVSCDQAKKTEGIILPGEVRIITVKGCMYVVATGYYGPEAITHAGNCDNHGSNR
jgi:hypothetical protein